MNAKVANIAVMACPVIWGMGYVASAFTLQEGFLPFQTNAIRFIIASLVFAVLFWKSFKNLNREIILAGCIIGLFMFGGFGTQTVGLLYTTPSKNAFLTSTVVVMVPFLNWVLTKVRPDKYSFISAFMALFGAALLSLDFSNLTKINLGDVLTMAGAVCFAFQMIMTNRFVRKFENDILLLTTIQFITAGVLSLVSMFLFEGNVGVVSSKGMFWMGYLCLFSSIICYGIQNNAQKFLHPTKLAVIFSTEAVFGMVFSALLFGEIITFKMLVGSVLLFMSIIIVETKLNFLKRPRQEDVAV